MATLHPDVLRAIDAAIKAAEQALDTAYATEPQGHRVEMVKSQLEVARDVLLRARGFAAAKQSGTYPLPDLKKP